MDERLTRIEIELRELDERLSRIERVMYGNGSDSLLERIARLEAKIDAINGRMKLVMTVASLSVSLIPVVIALLSLFSH